MEPLRSQAGLQAGLHEVADVLQSLDLKKINKSKDLQDQINWCFAKAKERLYEKTFSNESDLVRGYPLATIAHSLVSVSRRDEELLHLIAKIAIKNMQMDISRRYDSPQVHYNDQEVGYCNAQELAMLARAFSNLKVPHINLFKHIACSSILKIDSFSDQGLTMLARAFACVGFRDQSLFQAIQGVALPRLNRLNAENLVGLSHSFFTLGLYNVTFFSALEDVIISNIEMFSNSYIKLLEKSFPTGRHPKLFTAIQAVKDRRCSSAVSPVQELPVSKEFSAVSLGVGLDPLLVDLSNTLLNAFPKDGVNARVRFEGIQEAEEVEYHVDFLIPEYNLAIQFIPLPSSSSDVYSEVSRILEFNGYKIVNVSRDDWNALQTTKEKERYLLQKFV